MRPECLLVSKYPPNAIFRNANINARLNDLAYKSAAAPVENAFARPIVPEMINS